ncbi:hypothetical protein N7532_009554 [Penicillium argentinense]|uniref:Uncharacterized protein n=1 Tax=Penicillium argentinense TaxID=1131581 RepID=A0A9W9K2Z2_9EURO|nr:uncharacterized protein N7532_009554 [Penicillium argentinense]KAJ5090870.1 hypothetical protein N7532_009554 [Penicillium argentinense]
MSDFLRRASDAFHHRDRQGSAGSVGSTDAPESPGAAKSPTSPEQDSMNQKSQSTQPTQPTTNFEPSAGIASGNTANTASPNSQRRHWGWPHKKGGKPETKQPSSQEQKDTDWIIGT